MLEAKINEKEDTEPSSVSMINEIDKLIDKDQYNTTRVFESLNNLSGLDNEAYKNITSKISGLSVLNPEDKLLQYSDLRCEESELQKKLGKQLEDTSKVLYDLVNEKYTEIDVRIEALESFLGPAEYYSSERKSIQKNFSEVPKITRSDLENMTLKLKLLLMIEKDVFILERHVPKLNPDSFMLLSLKETEKTLSDLTKSSLCTIKALESFIGEAEVNEKFDISSIHSHEINIETYTTISESFKNWAKSLKDLENMKESLLQSSSLNQQLQSLDSKLTFYFFSAEQHKQSACNKLKRLSKDSTGFGGFLQEILKHTDISKRTLSMTIHALKEKTEKFLKTAEDQDKVIVEITQKLMLLDEKIDEIELKHQDLASAEFKELYKSIPLTDLELKSELDLIKKTFSDLGEDSSKDLMERLNSLSEKIELARKFGKIKESIRKSQSSEVTRIKTELQEKINELSSSLSKVENEKNTLETSYKTLKSNYDKTSEVADKIIKGSSEKDMEVTGLKNNIASLEETIDQLKHDYDQIQDELSEIKKEARDAKRNLRLKENELNELKQSLEKDS
ncbi:hypothetical protein SteCoe_36926 [Stentor coeruleus]|uniref:Uncharacterized protein n=1 Tax=Stentor coeruleus TaxID=5963 RepID=A0A1R2APB7_9CILI|nr:hypothetical protein SteCoe_36926 [Stentor coeruleus]